MSRFGWFVVFFAWGLVSDAAEINPRLPYSPAPNDRAWDIQWNMENRDLNGIRLGADLNVRGAWGYTRGAGVTIAIVDTGVELSHPELAERMTGPHFNFDVGTTNGNPVSARSDGAHGTAMAGLAAATQNNERGISGVAPEAGMASWVIFTTNFPPAFVSRAALAEMFQYKIQDVQIQNHSWTPPVAGLTAVSPAEDLAISNAVTAGRGGKGVIMVRASGNARQDGRNANDDAYISDPRAIAVGAVNYSGRSTSYSNPGAAILVAAPSGDNINEFAFYTNLISTDLTGTDGFNYVNFEDDSADYTYATLWDAGTSAATAEISGLCALILAANPGLTYRDVQQVLINSSLHYDDEDATATRNAAGYLKSHTVGFGVPDAGWAIWTALAWSNRPAAVWIEQSSTQTLTLQDAGLRVEARVVSGIATNNYSWIARASLGENADLPTGYLPIVNVGLATNTPSQDLTGKGALLFRGGGPFLRKLENVQRASAEFAILANNSGGTTLETMRYTETIGIPAVFLGQNDGLTLSNLIESGASLTVQLRTDAASYAFNITETLLTEHVGVRIRTEHPRRGDLRVVLISPTGTKSVLQAINTDNAAGPTNWTYYSTHHFYESSAGEWKVLVSDQIFNNQGSVKGVDLLIQGVPITDTDHDGLDDTWELTYFGDLLKTAAEDSDSDGYRNAREQILGTDPRVRGFPLRVGVDRWSSTRIRLSWPGVNAKTYEIHAGTDVENLGLIHVMEGNFPETEFFISSTSPALQFFKIVERP
ncbi:MAG: S8 family serine peptidase [Verrucomicrobiota bacterium]|nr:S8 family serine peptidase [Verrucomicrobiota bacterium]